MGNDDKAVSLSAKDLKEIIAAAVSEAVRAPKVLNEIEQRQLDREKKQVEDNNQSRLEQSQAVIEDMRQKALRKRACAHEGGKPVHPHTVFVNDDLGGFVLCQKCHAVIRPENQISHFPKDFQEKRPDVIFSNEIFNRVFQHTDAGGGLFN